MLKRHILRYLTAIALLALTACNPCQIAQYQADHANRTSHEKGAQEDDARIARDLATCHRSFSHCWIERDGDYLSVYGR